MPDFRVADTAPEHPKLRAAGLAAVGLWTTSGAYAMRELTDGFVPEYWVKTWPAGVRSAARLVSVGLWQETTRAGVRGYTFHDWTDYQRPAERFQEDRERARERAAKSRRTRGERAPHADRTFAEASRAPSPSPSPSSQDGDFGGDVPDSNTHAGAHRPPASNLDPNNPRCPRHRHLPVGDRGPNCLDCRDIRQRAESHDPEAERRRQFRAAVDACPECDDRGMLELADGSPARCSHRAMATR